VRSFQGFAHGAQCSLLQVAGCWRTGLWSREGLTNWMRRCGGVSLSRAAKLQATPHNRAIMRLFDKDGEAVVRYSTDKSRRLHRLRRRLRPRWSAGRLPLSAILPAMCWRPESKNALRSPQSTASGYVVSRHTSSRTALRSPESLQRRQRRMLLPLFGIKCFARSAGWAWTQAA
jgi:hypothetical protein